MKNIILCIDFDDAIYPNPNTYFGSVDDVQEILEMNMKRIKMVLDSHINMKVFITSSWYSVLYINNDGTLGYERENAIKNGEMFLIDEYNAFKIIQEGVSDRVIGLSCGDRIEDIYDLLKKDNLVIAIDDINLSKEILWFYSENKYKPMIDKNYLFLETYGFLTNRHLFWIKKFLDDHDEL